MSISEFQIVSICIASAAGGSDGEAQCDEADAVDTEAGKVEAGTAEDADGGARA